MWRYTSSICALLKIQCGMKVLFLLFVFTLTGTFREKFFTISKIGGKNIRANCMAESERMLNDGEKY